jgi:hypothetical protein
MLRREALVRTDVSEEHVACITKVKESKRSYRKVTAHASQVAAVTVGKCDGKGRLHSDDTEA